MSEELTTKIKAPKTVEEQLDQLIEGTRLMFEANPTMKSNALKALWREGNLNKEFILTQAELIAQRKSDLSASKRQAVLTFIRTADLLFTEMNKNRN